MKSRPSAPEPPPTTRHPSSLALRSPKGLSLAAAAAVSLLVPTVPARADILLSNMYNAVDLGGGLFEYAVMVKVNLPLEGGFGDFTILDVQGYVPGSITWNDFAGVVWEFQETPDSIWGSNDPTVTDLQAKFSLVGNPFPAGPGELGYLTYQSSSAHVVNGSYHVFAIQDTTGNADYDVFEHYAALEVPGRATSPDPGNQVPEASTLIPAAVLGIGVLGMYLRRRAVAA